MASLPSDLGSLVEQHLLGANGHHCRLIALNHQSHRLTTDCELAPNLEDRIFQALLEPWMELDIREQ